MRNNIVFENAEIGIGHFTVVYLVTKPSDLRWGWKWPCRDEDQYLVSMIYIWKAARFVS